MADSPKNTSKAEAQDNLGQSGTDQFKTYQDEAGLKAKSEPKVKLNHGEKSPAQKQDEESAGDLSSLGLPAQMLPENQDESVK